MFDLKELLPIIVPVSIVVVVSVCLVFILDLRRNTPVRGYVRASIAPMGSTAWFNTFWENLRSLKVSDLVSSVGILEQQLEGVSVVTLIISFKCAPTQVSTLGNVDILKYLTMQPTAAGVRFVIPTVSSSLINLQEIQRELQSSGFRLKKRVTTPGLTVWMKGSK